MNNVVPLETHHARLTRLREVRAGRSLEVFLFPLLPGAWLRFVDAHRAYEAERWRYAKRLSAAKPDQPAAVVNITERLRGAA